MNVISSKELEFTTIAKVSDGTDTAILEFANAPVLGVHPFKPSDLSDEEYEALEPDTEKNLQMQIILENTSVNMSALFASYNS